MIEQKKLKTFTCLCDPQNESYVDCENDVLGLVESRRHLPYFDGAHRVYDDQNNGVAQAEYEHARAQPFAVEKVLVFLLLKRCILYFYIEKKIEISNYTFD